MSTVQIHCDVRAIIDETTRCVWRSSTATRVAKSRRTLAIEGASNSGQGRAWELNGPEMGSRNSAAHPELVGIRDRDMLTISNDTAYRFPAHSVTVLEIALD